MTLIVKEIQAKTILSVSKIYPYVINQYTGCQHACSYCYARFMKRVTGHREPWGEFVDVKINAADLLRLEIKKKKRRREEFTKEPILVLFHTVGYARIVGCNIINFY